ncbi:oxysterol-binding protein-related protein 1C [Impatiens glandulifera]|uniref:oxysterol-binding protein-related protein 1C n=1 Tax=Impatiens glandulifera TaxID=253017 RepID=UPI001FB0F644|nr:oxysterol-binding protein-related protein 1C [Impatiens glandulifera]
MASEKLYADVSEIPSRIEEEKVNEIAIDGISGVLYKRKNFGRGWRPRWFVLKDGVVSYYKIRGADKVSPENARGSRIIGEESLRRVSYRQILPPKLIGEIHIKVSSIHESKSSEKRFTIFTGIKKMNLRAKTLEDRTAWVETLRAAKDMFPRISNLELMAPVENSVVSTEKLRMRLMDEGMSEEMIRESERIMKSEYTALQSQLVMLKQKHWDLLTSLQQLEVEVMNRRKNHSNKISSSSSSTDKVLELPRVTGLMLVGL